MNIKRILSQCSKKANKGSSVAPVLLPPCNSFDTFKAYLKEKKLPKSRPQPIICPWFIKSSNFDDFLKLCLAQDIL